ncbi:MAG: hypothetical protein LBN29_05915 [Mediterranea sp.]|jgi:hypothetical protein|nr:hypothetical protein [Mediterranea sp.]
MKKNVLYMLCASALLALGACAEDIAAPADVDPVSPPEANGLVRIRLSVQNEDYQDAAQQTRVVPEEPVQFVQELGDGYTLVSELTPAPKTRAGSVQLETGTKVLMIAFERNAERSYKDSIPIGYQQIAINETGEAEFDLPASDIPYRVVFYTENSKTDFTSSDIGNIISYSGTGVTTPVGTNGYYKLPTTSRLLRRTVPTTGTESTNSEIPVDVMYAVIDNVTVPADGEPTMTPTWATFKHPFAMLNWTLMVNPSATNHEYIARTEIGLYPRRKGVAMNLGFLAKAEDPASVPAQSTWSPSRSDASAVIDLMPVQENTGSFLNYDIYTDPSVAGQQLTTLVQSLRFIPASNSDVASTLAVKKLTFETDYDSVTIRKRYPIKVTNGGAPLVFQAGKQYNITSKLTKAPFFKPKKVLGISDDNGIYGIGTGGGSNLFLTSRANFSASGGTVPVNGLTITTFHDDLYSSISNRPALTTLLTTPSSRPDIIVMSVYAHWDWVASSPNSYPTSTAIKNYLDNGGVVIQFVENNAAAASRGLSYVTEGKLTIAETGLSPVIYPMNGPENDPIMSGEVGGVTYNFKSDENGSTASLVGKNWGADYIGTTTTFAIDPNYADDFVVYSTSSTSQPVMLRYKNTNLFVCGDAGFLTSATGTTDNMGNNYDYPFVFNRTATVDGENTYRAVSKTYGGTTTRIDNAQIFGNIMAWAIYQAEHYGINTGNFSKRPKE